MNKFIDKIKNLVAKKEPSLAEMYDLMNQELKKAEDDVGGDFFPKEKVLTPEQVHYATLELKQDATFEDAKASYSELKKKYNPEKFEKDSDEYKEFQEKVARLEFSYAFFKQKFGINE